ncbi:exosortase X [Hymenobacter siberiensis]|jgi:exosortase family protein XrtF|uniref:exosortase X n=1 Tax=Hymenobacter siberiensis TaxID=2848396 RepID=UPI001C1E45C1|nr:archaeosortase/exosortase family protein [Hymenobacter siberiensis]MBU6123390.1 archaeosortase/exosortase family protein [Hymenobacter siberiensis]
MPSLTSVYPSAGSNRLIFRFMLVAGALYLAWFFGYEQWLAVDGRLDAVLCHHIAAASVGLLRTGGFAAALAGPGLNLVLMSGEPSVIVGAPCNGLVLYALFGGFILAFPGSWRRKVWFIPSGMLLIWVLNVLRVAALAVNHHYSHETVAFNHHFTFTFVVYGVIFGLWMFWVRRLAASTSDRPLSPLLTDAAHS